MGKIFKQLARHWAACLAVVALLFVQAYCDLSLPDYTSKIVDTGIQQGGIESPLPETVRQSTLDALSLLMSEEDADALQNAYGYYLQDDGVLKLRSDLPDAERTALEDAVTTPDIVLYMAAAQNANAPAGQNAAAMAPLSGYQSEDETAGAEAETMTAAPTAEDLDAVCAQFTALAQMPGFSREMIQQQLASAMEQVDETTLSSMASQATLLVSLEYEAQGGSNVSGGQKQRLSIARAIAKDPKIYLFDDSFSALDYKTDVTLRRALKEETDNATVIIVAQRISTVLHANQILVLDDGRLVGKGTHAQLMATCPEYQEIARSQLSQKELNLQDLNTGKEDE